MSIFQFSNINKSEEIIQRTWNDFRSALAIGSFSYDDIVCAKSRTTFLKVFDDLFSNCHQELDITMQAALSPTTTLMRAGKLNPNDPEPTYSRFIPNKEYITDHNRFSPPGVEWLYLAVGDFDTAKKCALKECRASSGDTFGLCEFRLSENYAVRTLVDLTIANTISYEEINERLRRAESEIKNREKDKILMSISKKGYVKFPDVSDIKYEFSKWMAYTYVKLLSEQIFVPVETEDKKLMYSPFQCMAQYFLLLGYEGIIYSSTVFPEGKNVVLFDKDAANPIGKIIKQRI